MKLRYAVFLCIVTFGVLALNYITDGPLVAVDIWLTGALFTLRSDAGVFVMSTLTLLASPLAIIALLGITSIVLFVRKQWRAAVVLLGGLVATEGFTYFAKIFFHRERPSEALRAIVETSFSLPSGHATSAAFVAGILVYFIVRSSNKNLWVKICAGAVGLLFVVLIDFTRVYLGVHYFTDVIAGNMVGLVGALSTIWILKSRLLRVARNDG